MLTYRNNVLLSHSDVAMEGATWDSVLENNMISGGMCGTEDLGPGSTIIQESTQRVYNRGA